MSARYFSTAFLGSEERKHLQRRLPKKLVSHVPICIITLQLGKMVERGTVSFHAIDQGLLLVLVRMQEAKLLILDLKTEQKVGNEAASSISRIGGVARILGNMKVSHLSADGPPDMSRVELEVRSERQDVISINRQAMYL